MKLLKRILKPERAGIIIISTGTIALALAVVVGVNALTNASEDQGIMDLSAHSQHFTANSGDHNHSSEAAAMLIEPGQGMFGALSEINIHLEKSDTSWANVDMDSLWEHLRDMDALMTGVTVTKTNLPDGLQMFVSGEGSARRAMDNMLSTHSVFMRSVRPAWDIQIEQSGSSYIITVTSSNPTEAQRIQALGFSGFMVQDDHHASHHLGLALGEVVH